MESKGLEQNTENALACDLPLALKDKIFPVKRGNGYKYYNSIEQLLLDAYDKLVQ